MTPEEARKLHEIFNVRFGDPFNPTLVFHQAAKVFEEIAYRLEVERQEREANG